jgi:outer membrane protein assembly factor BamB
MRVARFAIALVLVACSRTDPFDTTCGPNTIETDGVCVGNPNDGTTCGPGTHLVGNECVANAAVDAGHDAIADGAGDAPADVLPDWSQPSYPDGEATSFAIDPAHDNAQPNDVVASPLSSAWSANLNGEASYPLVVADKVIFAAQESQPNVRALDIATGKLVWGPLTFGSTPLTASDAGRVYALSGGGQIVALDVATGAKLWTTQLQGQIDFWSPPIATSGMVFVNGLESGGTTYAIDGSTGKTIWTKNTFDGSDGAPAFQSGVVYEAEACDQLSAFDALTGTLLFYHHTSCTGGGGSAPSVYMNMIWERDWAVGDAIIDTKGNDVGTFKSDVVPAFHAGLAFYLSKSVLTAVDIATSTIKWSFSGDGFLCTSPVVAGGGGQVFIASGNGVVYELDEITGTQKSSASTGNVVCGTEKTAVSLGLGHLLIPIQNGLVAF